MNDLIEPLRDISTLYGVIGLKQSFEDEGVLLDDVITVRRLTEMSGVMSFVKIGGCEAKSDINNCLKLGIDGIIAPMVETPFAVTKFMDCYDKRAQYFIVIESKTAYENIDDILKSCQGKLSGLIVGRSDLSKSYNLNKTEADSNFIYNVVENILYKAKQYNLLTTLGGNISVKSSQFIDKMFNSNLLNRIETRNVVIGLNNKNVKVLDLAIQESINFEILLLNKKLRNSNYLCDDYKRRIELLRSRK